MALVEAAKRQQRTRAKAARKWVGWVKRSATHHTPKVGPVSRHPPYSCWASVPYALGVGQYADQCPPDIEH